MSSIGDIEAYDKTIKLIEVFSSYFERVAETSPSYPNHLESLAQFKSQLYSNLYTPHKLDTYMAPVDTYLPKLESYAKHDYSSMPVSPYPDSITNKHELLGIKNDLDTHDKLGGLLFNLGDHLIPVTTSVMDISSNNSPIKRNGGSEYIGSITTINDYTPQAAGSVKVGSLSAFNDFSIKPEIFPTFQLEYRSDFKDTVTIFDFLSKIRATEHSLLSELFLLSEQYSHARAFNGSQQTLFLALSFAFFENLLLGNLKMEKVERFSFLIEKILDKRTEYKIAVHRPAYEKLITDLKKYLEEGGYYTGSSLYESIVNNPDLYEASLILFMEILIENITSKQILTEIAKHNSETHNFKWMNDVPLTNMLFYQELASILRSSLKIITLDSTHLEQQSFPYINHAPTVLDLMGSPRMKDTNEVVIMIDKRIQSCYLLYKTREKWKSNITDLRPTKVDSSFNYLNTLTLQKTPKKYSHHVKNLEEDRKKWDLSSQKVHTGWGKAFDFSPDATSLKKKAREGFAASPSKTFHLDENLYDNNVVIDGFKIRKHKDHTDNLYGTSTSPTLVDTLMNSTSIKMNESTNNNHTDLIHLMKASGSPSHDVYSWETSYKKPSSQESLNVDLLLGGTLHVTEPTHKIREPPVQRKISVHSENPSPLAKAKTTQETLMAVDEILRGLNLSFNEPYTEKIDVTDHLRPKTMTTILNELPPSHEGAGNIASEVKSMLHDLDNKLRKSYDTGHLHHHQKIPESHIYKLETTYKVETTYTSEVKSVPSYLKDQFETLSRDIKNNEKDIKKITARYLENEAPEKKNPTGTKLLLVMKYKGILQKKKLTQASQKLYKVMKSKEITEI